MPIPWSGDAPPFGFSPDGVTTWLPQPEAWKDLTAEAQAGDPGSMLELYRAALRLRRNHPALGEGDLSWQEAPEGVLLFSRTPGFVCAVNLSGDAVPAARPHRRTPRPAARSTVTRFRVTPPCGWPSDPSELGGHLWEVPHAKTCCGFRGRVRPHRGHRRGARRAGPRRGPAEARRELTEKTRLPDRRSVVIGDRFYSVSTEDGLYPATGWHTTGEMGGIWTPPLKLLDGVWFGLDGSWLGKQAKAESFTAGHGYTRIRYDSGGVQVDRTDVAPDGVRAGLIGLKLTSAKARTVRLDVDAHSELMTAYPWGSTTPDQQANNLPDTGVVRRTARWSSASRAPRRCRTPPRTTSRPWSPRTVRRSPTSWARSTAGRRTRR